MLAVIAVDLFAGGGGASLGLELAGVTVEHAVNHWPTAISVHARNHRETTHHLESVWRVRTVETPPDVLWASPDCTHFSRAKGGKPRAQKIRSLAWSVVRWAAQSRPRMIVVENVPEFSTWGPLDREGNPIVARQGQTFRAWVRKLQRLGYVVDWRVLSACDYGAPTTRRRLYVVARRDGRIPQWPSPTHGPGRARPWRTAAEVIDWSLPVPSIFDRAKPLVEATLARIARGIRRFVVDDPDPFVVGGIKQGLVVAYLARHFGGRGTVGSSMREPLRTVTAQDHHALVTALIGAQSDVRDIGMRLLTPRELARAQGFPDDYVIDTGASGERITRTDQVRLIGNSVCPPVARAIVEVNR